MRADGCNLAIRAVKRLVLPRGRRDNLEGGLGTGEGDTGIYGGDDPNDNSGSLRYVRVEFSGVEFSPDNELNGIAFQGVGRGGSYEYLQAHMSRDDAMEWFGGTADIIHAVTATTGQVDNGTSQMGAGEVWNIPTPLHSSVAAYVNSGHFPNVRTNVDPGVSTTACSNHEAPNFQPSSVATLAGGQLAPIVPPSDGFFEVTTYIGAVALAPEDDWTQGWTSYPQR